MMYKTKSRHIKSRLLLLSIALLVLSFACNMPNSLVDNDEFACEESGGEYIRPKDGQKNYCKYPDDQGNGDETNVPVGTYTGKSNFHSTLENDVDDSFAEPICKENIVTVVVESDGTSKGELRSICHANAREGERSIHSEVKGIINGNLTDFQGQCIVSYVWRSYHDAPQCTPDTPCRDETVNFDFLYNVNVSGNVMTFTPAGEVEDYYAFELTKQ